MNEVFFSNNTYLSVVGGVGGFVLSKICFFEVRFFAALASWLCRLHSFWLFMADKFV